MQPWKMILIIVLVIALIPTVTLMNQVEKAKAAGDTAQQRKKQKILQWCIRLLIVIFLVALGITMCQQYGLIGNA